MDSYELNKVLGAVLFTCLVTLTVNIAAGAIFTPKKPEKPGYEIAVPEVAPGAAPGAPAEPAKPLPELLASADPKKGETSAKKCLTCHTFGKGEPNRVGPNLYGVVGRARASHPGFNYSAAMKSKPGNWTLEEIDHFVANPKGFIPGTTMSFAGVPRATERADLLAYLNTVTDNPAPLPKAADAAPAGGAPAPSAAAPAPKQ
jgi:cytochrome c